MPEHLIEVLQAVEAHGKGQIPAAGRIAKETGLTAVAVQETFARAARMGLGDLVQAGFTLNAAGREIVAGREYQNALA